MSMNSVRPLSIVLILCVRPILACAQTSPPSPPRPEHQAQEARQGAGSALTIADIVGLTTIVGDGVTRADIPSPDGQQIAILARRGDVARNVVISTLLLFRTSELLTTPRADTVLIMASSSNRPAISHIRWLPDNRTMIFLGEQAPDTIPQVYAVDTRTRRLTQRTHHPTAVTAFDIPPAGELVLYTAVPQPDTNQYATWRQHGLVVQPTQSIGDLITGLWAPHGGEVPELFLLRGGAAAPVRLPFPAESFTTCWAYLSVSPTGTAVLLACLPQTFPVEWAQFQDPRIEELIHKGSWWPQYFVFDLIRGTFEPLMNVPVPYQPLFPEPAVWAPDGHAVVFGNTFLPLDVSDQRERTWRTAHRAVAEIDVHTHAVTVITRRDSLAPVRWDAATNTVELARVEPEAESLRPSTIPSLYYQRTAGGWREAKAHEHRTANGKPPLLTLDQAMNLPPRVVASALSTGERHVVFDPNPGLLTRFRLGREQVIHWTTPAGAHWDGGLYLPPDYDRHRRYPLVIQTHGFDSTAFWPDGPTSTTYAAQPLANAGIAVLQIGGSRERIPSVTAREAEAMQEGIEAAITHLDSMGLVDPTKVGLAGFSRTCYYTEYTLTHSASPFAAVIIADGVDMGYLQYMLFEQGSRKDGLLLEADSINGGPPFGATLARWLERAPGFNLDRVHAPVLVETIGPQSLLAEWELYAGLLLRGKPVEMLYLPEAAHILVKPLERLASQQGSVDWFRFWLKGEEDTVASKADQYARWRELRKLQDSRTASDTTTTRRD
jgi:dipeptidyl aminopeptidase/acylaminoacyl peptidase